MAVEPAIVANCRNRFISELFSAFLGACVDICIPYSAVSSYLLMPAKQDFCFVLKLLENVIPEEISAPDWESSTRQGLWLMFSPCTLAYVLRGVPPFTSKEHQTQTAKICRSGKGDWDGKPGGQLYSFDLGSYSFRIAARSVNLMVNSMILNIGRWRTNQMSLKPWPVIKIDFTPKFFLEHVSSYLCSPLCSFSKFQYIIIQWVKNGLWPGKRLELLSTTVRFVEY